MAETPPLDRHAGCSTLISTITLHYTCITHQRGASASITTRHLAAAHRVRYGLLASAFGTTTCALRRTNTVSTQEPLRLRRAMPGLRRLRGVMQVMHRFSGFQIPRVLTDSHFFWTCR
jgi:hypothetical protein